MPLTHDEIFERWGRAANIGTPSASGTGESWFGRITVGRAGEPWPRWNRRPLRPVLQVRVADLPAPIDGLEDLAFVQLFADFESNGTMADSMHSGYPDLPACWKIRTFTIDDTLVGISPPNDLEPWAIPSYRIDWEARMDAPCWEDAGVESEDWPDDDDGLNNLAGIKVGGWPSLVQSQIYWAPHNEHPSNPQFVLQLTADCGLIIGHSGTMFIGRGTRGHPEEWALDWQCY
jgi:hypothetical protein